LDDPFDLLREAFRVVHPAWSIPLAAAFLAAPVAWFHYKVQQPALKPLAYLLGGIPAVVALAAGFAGWKYRQERQAFLQANVDIAWLSDLTWREFERRVADMYRDDGFTVEETGGGGADGGVDLQLRKNGRTTIVQCKKWRSFKVGVRPVRELYGVMVAEKADRAVFVSSGIYTQEALEFARGKPLDLIDGAQLATMLKRGQSAALPGSACGAVKGAGSNTEAPERPKCPRCGSEMVLRRARTGPKAGREFWGCPAFPKCRGVVEVE
jgi:restriction system protein